MSPIFQIQHVEKFSSRPHFGIVLFVHMRLTYLLTYSLTHSLHAAEKLTGFQLVQKFPAFYGTRRFITAFIKYQPRSEAY